MQPPETPIPPWALRPHREIPPSILSPSFSRRPFPRTAASVPAAAAADGDNGGAVSEHAYIELYNWWLASVEGDDKKFFVAGLYERNQTVQQLAPTPIAKRHKSQILETEDGVVLNIYGSLNLSRMRGNGYTDMACEYFLTGFPYWWDSCNHLSLKETKSQTGCPPSSLFEKGKQFYLERYQLGERLHNGATLMSKLLKSVKRMTPRKDAAFQSSHLSNGAPRFEEYTCDGGSLTNENSAASNGEGERHEALCYEVDNAERYLTVGRALRERDGGVIKNNASLLLTVEGANDNGNKEANNAPPTSNQRDPEPTSVCLDVQTSSYLSNEISRFEKNTCLGDIPANEDAAALNDDSERCTAVLEEVNSMEISLIALSEKAAVDEEMPTSVCIDAPNSSYLSNEIPRFEKNTCLGDIPNNEDAAALNDKSERCTAVPEEVNSMEIGLTVGSAIEVSLDPRVECTNDTVNEGADNTSLLGCKKTPVASLKSQGCRGKHLQIPSNEKPSTPKKQRSKLVNLQGPTRSPFASPIPYAHDSPLTRGRVTSLSMSTPEALKLRKTRSGRVVVPTLDAGCQRIVYDMDGMIAGVIGLDSPSPKGSNLKTYARKKSAEPAAASKLKTYTRKKRRAEPAAASKMKTYARRKKTRAE